MRAMHGIRDAAPSSNLARVASSEPRSRGEKFGHPFQPRRVHRDDPQHVLPSSPGDAPSVGPSSQGGAVVNWLLCSAANFIYRLREKPPDRKANLIGERELVCLGSKGGGAPEPVRIPREVLAKCPDGDAFVADERNMLLEVVHDGSAPLVDRGRRPAVEPAKNPRIAQRSPA